MITTKKLKIYKGYKGDIDAFTRTGAKKDQDLIGTKDWYLLGIIQLQQ